MIQADYFRGARLLRSYHGRTVVGATAGAVPPVREYFRKIRAVCDRYGVLLILDEIRTRRMRRRSSASDTKW
ncbi:hypothetical protein [Paraburkholderia sp. SIMBA_030]|uniref:hypothetical protein n=1 Tax=Paraburkholderia sp. SIMBA_030 TaxID=3085773 RepID=UPI003979FB09